MPENIEKIVEIFTNRETIEHVSRLVKYEELKEQNYNLSISTYVKKEDTKKAVDIKVLNAKIEEIVKRENELRLEIDKIIKEIEGQINE